MYYCPPLLKNRLYPDKKIGESQKIELPSPLFISVRKQKKLQQYPVRLDWTWQAKMDLEDLGFPVCLGFYHAKPVQLLVLCVQCLLFCVLG